MNGVPPTYISQWAWYSLANTRTVSGYNQRYTYEVSPHDAMNNYYIYSRNNIFYSGVGHSTVNSDEERKLFVNVVIAAYNAGMTVLSHVEVEDADEIAHGTGVQKAYELKITQDYADRSWVGTDNYDDQYLYKLGYEDFAEAEPYGINFIPKDPNAKDVECVIVYEYTEKGGTSRHRVNITDLALADNKLGVFKVDSSGFDILAGREKLLDVRWGDLNKDFELDNGQTVNRVLKLTSKEKYRLWINRNDIFWKRLSSSDIDVESCRVIFYLRNQSDLNLWTQTTADISVLPLFLLE